MTELWQHSALELAALIRERRVTSRAVVEAHLQRIREINPGVNAITRTLDEEALEAAERADLKLGRADQAGPLHGVPFTVKENVDVAGSATTWGLAALGGAVATADAPVVVNLRAAGAIPIARTNMPDLALRWHTDNAPNGATVNPWRAEVTPGGSSGGEAVALATGMTPLGVGNDLGGSLRWPAQCCGIASLRPTLGRVPDVAVTTPADPLPGLQLLNVQGPMARWVADLRAAFDLMRAAGAHDPRWAPVEAAEDVRACRVALVIDPDGLGVDANVAAGVRAAADALARAGYDVEEATPPPFMGAAELWMKFVSVDMQLLVPPAQPLLSADAVTFLAHARAGLPELDVAGYAGAYVERFAQLRAWTEFFERYPLIVAPISTTPPFPVGFDLTADGVQELIVRMRAVIALNALGLPAAAVPVGVADGLPQAVQVIGARFQEERCLAAAEAIEGRMAPITPIEPRTA